MCLGGLTTLAMTANRLYVHPFLVAKGQTADRKAWQYGSRLGRQAP